MKFRIWYREPGCAESGPWTCTAPDTVTAAQQMHDWFRECAGKAGYEPVEITRIATVAEPAPATDHTLDPEAHLRSLRWITG
jgi:hypothetical protein